MAFIRELLAIPYLQAIGVALISLICAWLIELIITKTIAVAASKTQTDIDDAIIEIVRRPIFVSVLLYGLSWAMELLALRESFSDPIDALLETLAILIWTLAIIRIGTVLLQSGSAKGRERSMLQPRTLPVFDMVLKGMAVAACFYFMFLAWDIDLTAWLASAGILGVALGFGAKDTVANLISGIFILADGPYKVKDWIALDDQVRGEVTHIGFRCTRVLTNDDVEITVPNAVIGNARVLNETAGPHVRQRVRVKFRVAYGSDLGQVRAIVLAGLEGTPDLLTTPAPVIRFRGLGEFGLNFEAWVWIEVARIRDIVVDDVSTRIYESLNAANIEIPYYKADGYVRQLPAS